ncbi:L-2-amino-thiazoline-4-carboxylic acid hydrolase [Saccharothrix lopnurensis]|uniref:L-2-amino-thiazoline-4-carboxylic acid hydrolase n=1 Tax=Saccharothrix lopnurensis TaxID=1670621 RepID=A0ABW1P6N8_9PSEU
MTTDHPTQDHYVPDPDADTAAVVDGVLAHLAAVTRERGLPDDLPAAVRERHGRLVVANRHLVVDEPARHNLRMTLVLVAAWELLRPHLGDDEALGVVRAAFVEPLAPVVREAVRAALDAEPDPYRAMVALARDRETTSFGAGFTFRHPVDDDHRFHADVHRCFYYDVLVANAAPELAPVLCEFDRNWIDAIDPDRHGFRFDRATTIGTGGAHCPFHFSRVTPDRA